MPMCFTRATDQRGGLSVLVLMILGGFALATTWHLVLSTSAAQLASVERARAGLLAEQRLAADLVMDAGYASGDLAGGFDAGSLVGNLQERLDALARARPQRVIGLVNLTQGGSLSGWMGTPAEFDPVPLVPELAQRLREEGVGEVASAASVTPTRVTLQTPHPWSGIQVPMEVSLQPVAVPMTWDSIVGYVRLEEVGRGLDMGVQFPSVLGSISQGDVGFVGAVPAGARGHIALVASAYAALFSPARMQMLSDLAGPTHRVVLGEDPVGIPITQPDLAGMQWISPSEARLDLARFGMGRRVTSAGEVVQQAAMVFVDGSRGGTLRLVCGAGAPGSAAVVVVLGPANRADTLTVSLDSWIERPLVLVGSGLKVTTTPGQVRAQALIYLDPDCILSIPGDLEVAHLSVHARLVNQLALSALHANQRITPPLLRAAPTALWFHTRSRVL